MLCDMCIHAYDYSLGGVDSSFAGSAPLLYTLQLSSLRGLNSSKRTSHVGLRRCSGNEHAKLVVYAGLSIHDVICESAQRQDSICQP